MIVRNTTTGGTDSNRSSSGKLDRGPRRTVLRKWETLKMEKVVKYVQGVAGTLVIRVTNTLLHLYRQRWSGKPEFGWRKVPRNTRSTGSRELPFRLLLLHPHRESCRGRSRSGTLRPTEGSGAQERPSYKKHPEFESVVWDLPETLSKPVGREGLSSLSLSMKGSQCFVWSPSRRQSRVQGRKDRTWDLITLHHLYKTPVPVSSTLFRTYTSVRWEGSYTRGRGLDIPPCERGPRKTDQKGPGDWRRWREKGTPLLSTSPSEYVLVIRG